MTSCQPAKSVEALNEIQSRDPSQKKSQVLCFLGPSVDTTVFTTSVPSFDMIRYDRKIFNER